MKIGVTGSSGFLGTNLTFRLRELRCADVVILGRHMDAAELAGLLRDVGFVVHLAGVNRSTDAAEFDKGNRGFTARLADAMQRLRRPPRVAYASSIQAVGDTSYGLSKRGAEEVLAEYTRETGAAVYVFRLPNVFGKWSRPDYNSVVATFCHHVSRGLPIDVHDPNTRIRLAYVDDVLDAMMVLVSDARREGGFLDVQPEYSVTVGELAEIVSSFRESRSSLEVPHVGGGLVRALYATYVSFLPPEAFSYGIPRHEDARGVFVEMLKTRDSGQVSYFTALPGVTRGEHYHHSKTEKFLVIKGVARFGFRELRTGQLYEIVVRGGDGRIVETIPGWAHDVTNVGHDELVVMLWANEVYDRRRPDTISMKVRP